MALGEDLQQLSDKIKAHPNLQVMVLYTKSEIIDEEGCFGGGLSRLEIIGQQLGVLNGDLTFNLENSRVILPTSKYLQKGEEPYLFDIDGYPWKLTEGGIAIRRYHFSPEFSFKNWSLPKLEVLLGDEVELYFSVGRTYFEEYLASRSEAWKEELLKEDNCLDEQNLIEFYCEENQIKSMHFKCECSNGLCKK